MNSININFKRDIIQRVSVETKGVKFGEGKGPGSGERLEFHERFWNTEEGRLRKRQNLTTL